MSVVDEFQEPGSVIDVVSILSILGLLSSDMRR